MISAHVEAVKLFGSVIKENYSIYIVSIQRNHWQENCVTLVPSRRQTQVVLRLDLHSTLGQFSLQTLVLLRQLQVNVWIP